MWALPSFRLIRRFHEHSAAVTSLIQPPQGVSRHMERWVLAIGADGAISIYDTNELEPPALLAADGSWRHADGGVACLVVLNGHAAPVRELQWRVAEGILCVRCALEWVNAPSGNASATSAVANPTVPSSDCMAGTAAGGSASTSTAPVGIAGGSAGGSISRTGRAAVGPRPASQLGGAEPLTLPSNSIVYVWQLPAGRLARVLRGPEVYAHLQTMAYAPLSQRVPELTVSRQLRSTSVKRLLENVRIDLGGSNPPLHALVFNLKRLIAETKREAVSRDEVYKRSPSPRVPRRVSRELFMSASKLGIDAMPTSPADKPACAATSTLADALKDSPSDAPDKNLDAMLAKDTGDTPNDSSNDGIAHALNGTFTDMANGAANHTTIDSVCSEPANMPAIRVDAAEIETPSRTSDSMHTISQSKTQDRPAGCATTPSRASEDVLACQAALSYMTCWGVDETFDQQCTEVIGLQAPVAQVTYGVRGESPMAEHEHALRQAFGPELSLECHARASCHDHVAC